MNKIAPLLLVLNLNTYFSSGVLAADGSCASLLSAKDFKNNFGSYLKELFNEGVVTEQELTSFRDALLHGERINPIQNPELDITRYIAFERIEDFFKQNLNNETLLETTKQIIFESDVASEARFEAVEELSYIMLRVQSADQGELIDLIKNYFSKPESVKDHKALKVAIEKSIEGIVSYYSSYVFSHQHWSGHPELLKLVIEKTRPNFMFNFATQVFCHEYWSGYPELLRMALMKAPLNSFGSYIEYVFSQEYWAKYPELLRLSIEISPKDYMSFYPKFVFSKEHWSNHPELLRLAMNNSAWKDEHVYIENVFSKEFWSSQADLKNSLSVNPIVRSQSLKKRRGPYSWVGTKQENIKEYLDGLYGRIDE